MIVSPYSKFSAGASAVAIATLMLLSSPASAQGAACPLSLSESAVDLESASASADLAACGVETVPILLTALEHPDWQQRAAAAYLLGQLGAEAELAVPALASVLADDHPAVRFTATRALGQIGSVEAVNALPKALEDEDESVRANGILALFQLGADAHSEFPQLFDVLAERGLSESAYPSWASSSAELQVAGLTAILEDGNWSIRSYAVDALAEMGRDQPDTLPLMSSSAHPSGLTRGLGDTVVRHIGSESLIEALQSPSAGTRRAAAQMLGKLRSAAAVPHLLALLKDADEFTRVASIEALGQIGSAAAVPALIEQMQADSGDVRREAAIALGRIHDGAPRPEVVAVLTAALPSDIGDSAAEALGHLGAETAVPALVTTMQEGTVAGCPAAAMALGRIGSPVAVAAVIEALQQQDWWLRSCALKAFGQIPSEASSEALVQARRQVVPLLVEALLRTWL
ncbi:MAG: HEAT repeat domain-containing protein, partial [Cyanobacteria bacterium Co-bin13]|nr:HEAT repeat domain-containing protein [Cyanobacteria bacterium Co-bin13]